jgi:ABC-type transporter Mla subunit MlaD
MTIEEKILEWVAIASSVNQVTGVKLAEILTEMNDVIATVNANNQALVATNQQMQATLNTLSNDFPALQASLNAHINNPNVHLSANDRGRLSAVGSTYHITEGFVENGLTFTQQNFTAYALINGLNNSGLISQAFDFRCKLIASINNTYKIEVWAGGRVPWIVNVRYSKDLQRSSPPNGYFYTFDFPAEYMPTTPDEAMQRTVGMKILFAHVYGNLA